MTWEPPQVLWEQYIEGTRSLRQKYRECSVKIFGEHQEKTLEQLRDVASRAERVALMADGHLGYIMPIGGVAAYRDRVPVSGVGFDIACGNAAIRTDLERADLPNLETLADTIEATFDFGVGGTNPEPDAPRDDPLFEDDAWEAVPGRHREALRTKAREQIGTIGGGNHYVDVFEATDGRIWVGVHFGSRGFGHTVASGFLSLSAGAPWGRRVKQHEGMVALDEPLGHDYWHLMELAGRYAYLGREWVARKVVEIMGGTEVELVHNHHNYAWREEHDGEAFIVVRKGATPAWPGQKGFVGASMGEDAVILEGADAEPGSEADRLQRDALFSTVHGAGRVMGRRAAKRSLDHDEVVRSLQRSGVVLRGGGLDEAPQVYKRLDAVLAEQGPTVRVLETLRPLVVCMAPDRSLRYRS
jgi:tRNA-splicing ligase RtcB (3'-phosphate/5'-hydroxy nucleic acid ligase)